MSYMRIIFTSIVFCSMTLAFCGETPSLKMWKTKFWEKNSPDEATAALCHFDTQTDNADFGSVTMTTKGTATISDTGRFGACLSLAPNSVLTLHLANWPAKGILSRSIDFWLRFPDRTDKDNVFLRMGKTSLSVDKRGCLRLNVNDEEAITSNTTIRPGSWCHLSYFLSFRYKNLVRAKITVNGREVIDQALDWKFISCIRGAILSKTIDIGDISQDKIPMELDDLRISLSERLFYDKADFDFPDSAKTVSSVGNKNLSSESGAISFWFQPQNWDVRESLPNFVSKRWNKSWGKQNLPIFTVFDKGKPVWELILDRQLKKNQDAKLLLHPGQWYPISISWYDGVFSIYVDKHKLVAESPFKIKLFNKRQKSWTADALKITSPNSKKKNTATSKNKNVIKDDYLFDIADLKISDRFLSTTEIANFADKPYDDRRQKDVGAVDVDCRLNGVAGRTELTVYKLKPSVKAVKMSIHDMETNEIISEKVVEFKGGDDILSCVMQTGPLAFREYEFRWSAVDENGKKGKVFKKRFNRVKPPWYGFKGGISDKVMPGWEPVVVDGDVIKIWGRTIVLSPIGLLQKIVSKGEDILAGTMVLNMVVDNEKIDMNQVKSNLKLIKSTEAEAVLETTTKLNPNLTLQVRNRVEFDGLIWFDFTLTSTSKTTIDDLQITIPYKEKNAELLHWWSGEFKFGRGIMRSPKVVYCDKLYEGDGVVFRSNDKDRILHTENQRGNFIPYIMMTSMERGMSWFARNDKGWTKNDKPAIEIKRDGRRVELQLNIINEPTIVDKTLEFSFGLQPIPLKKLNPQWRSNCGQNVLPDYHVGNCLKSKNGYKEHFNQLPDGLDWKAVNRRYQFGEDGSGSMRALHEREVDQFRKTYNRAPSKLEVRQPGIYFNMQWVGNIPDIIREWSDARGYGTDKTFDYWHYSPWFLDFAAWSWDQWLKNTPIEAVYFDDIWAAPQKQIGSDSAAYRLPDGHVQPGYQFLEYRERFKRLRRLFYENGKVPLMCIHMTHTYFTPYCGMFDIVLEGEDRYPNPQRPFKDKRDFLDKWSLPRLRFHNPEKWGLIPAWLGWGERWTWRKNKPWYSHQENAFTAAMALHDIEWRFPDEFMKKAGYRDVATKFIPYWSTEKPYTTQSDKTKLAIWCRPDKCLVLIVNTADADITESVAFDLKKLGLNPDAQLIDICPELGKKTEPDTLSSKKELKRPKSDSKTKNNVEDGSFLWRDGRLGCDVRKHEYRLFEIKNKKRD